MLNAFDSQHELFFFFKPQNNQEKTLKGNQCKDGSWPCKTIVQIFPSVGPMFICCCCNLMFYDWSECVMSTWHHKTFLMQLY